MNRYINENDNSLEVRPENEPFNYYIFRKEQVRFELFYEPKSIFARNVSKNNSISFLVDLIHDRYRTWSPDFVLKVSSGETVRVHILDSKYSNFKTVQEIHLQQCAVKYTTKMACIKQDGELKSVDSMTILYSDVRTGYDSFYSSTLGLYSDKDNINQNAYFPIIGMMPLHEDNTSEFYNFIEDITIGILNA